MSHPHPGSLTTYNSLTDKHLVGYFSNTRIRRHLQRSGLISRSGRIISEKEYRLNAMRKDHQRYVRECLAQAIFHKVLDMERHHQLEIKRKLENVVRKDRVQRIKVERSRRSVEDINPLLSPHPPAAPRNHYGRHALVDGEQSSPSQSSSSPRPNTAPGNMQRPVRLQPLPGYPTAGSTPKTSSRSKQKLLELEHDHQFPSGGDKSMMRLMNSGDYSAGLSPYQLPIINNYMIPVPPPPQKGDKNIKGVRHGTSRRRRFRPTTAPNGLEQLLTKDSGKFHKPSLHSNASVTMIYLGKSVHLSHDDTDYRDEIKVYQQHCGGENLCVYKGKLLEGETFHFTSKRHHGFPFSLTFFLNGIQMDRLSSCCEYKHRKSARLGGKHGYFGFVNVDRASPCYRCIIAMGLDKKPSPPKKKMKEDYGEKQEDSVKDEEHNEPSEGSVEQEATKHSTVEIPSAHGEGQEPAVEIGEEEREEKTQKGPENGSEDDQENASKDEYDEDFEADEERSDEKVNEEGQTDDQMNGMSKSPSDDEKDNLDHEKESKSSSQKALQASDSEKEESDGYSNSDSEEDKQDCKSVQEKIAEAIEIDHRLSSEPEPSDSSSDEEEENFKSTAHDIKEDGAFLAEAATACEKQKAAEQGAQEGQMVDEEKALEEQEEFVAEEGATDTEEAGSETALELDLLARKEAAAVMGKTVENVLAVKEEASKEKARIEEDLEESRVGEETAFQGEEAAEGNVVVEEDINEGEEAVEKTACEGKVVEKVSSEGKEVVEEVPEGEEAVEEAKSEAEEAEAVAECEGKKVVEGSVAEAEKAMEKADPVGKEVAERKLEGEEVVQEAASEGWETMGETEFVLEESVESVKVPIRGTATETVESVESRKVPIGEAVSGVEEAAAMETSEEEDVMEITPEEGEARNEATEEESEVEESPPLREEASLDKEIKRDTAIEEEARQDGGSIVEASEDEEAAEDPELEEEVVEEGTFIGESVPEETAYMGEELVKAGEEEVAEKGVSQIVVPEKKLVIEKKVPIAEEAIDKSTINVEEMAEGAVVEGVVVAEGMAMEEVEVAEESAEGEEMSAIESEEAMSVEAAGNGKVTDNETPPQGEEILEKLESGEKENAEVLSDWDVQTEDAGHEEGMEEEEAGSEAQKVMTEGIIPEEDRRSERTLPEVEKLMTPSSLRDEVEAVEAAPEVEGMTQEMAYHPDVVEKEAVDELMAKVRHSGGDDRTEKREMETVEEKIALKQLDTSKKIKIGKTETETLAEYPQGLHGHTDLLEVQHKEETPAHIKTDTTETSITEERN
ncbi:glutamate-rich protein 3 isoform X7 [Dermochelys coriacea]|uniref:glutamate-rich protein 3 isoform X7 n=1 Tax=Dermochelys coriacea TaxID=27794 RepID=UPI001CA94DC3|nr:glutamate-rich protein 3 isoform X7 [Dermochelys coriacea]